MLHPKNWLTIRPEGLYCIPGNFYIDPICPVDYALITHGHGDHARFGHKHVLATPDTIAIMKVRYTEQFAESHHALPYFTALLHQEVEITFIPAGHILGSAQIILVHQGARLIISGDYKRSPDPTCLPFHVEACDVFITEATFSLPIFKHPPIKTELRKLLNSLQDHTDHCHLVGAYALGKCQRLIMTLRDMGFDEPIYLHGALQKLTDLYRQLGFDLGEIRPAMDLDKKTSAGKLVLAPPSALHDRWSRRFGDTIIGNASGWMRIRARAKQKAIDLPLIISDHADWDELIQTIHDINPKDVWVTHGREDALVYYAVNAGFKAQALSLLGYDDHEE